MRYCVWLMALAHLLHGLNLLCRAWGRGPYALHHLPIRIIPAQRKLPQHATGIVDVLRQVESSQQPCSPAHTHTAMGGCVGSAATRHKEPARAELQGAQLPALPVPFQDRSQHLFLGIIYRPLQQCSRLLP